MNVDRAFSQWLSKKASVLVPETTSTPMSTAQPEGAIPNIRDLFTNRNTHPITLDFVLAKTFGPEWVRWEAETLWPSIHDAFKTEISELARAKVQVVKSLAVATSPWTQWQVFEKVVQGLNNNLPRFDIMQVPDLLQLYAAGDMMTSHWKHEWSDEVKAYIAAVVIHENVSFVPAPLDFVQLEISQPVYHCFDCGNVDNALFHDGICDTCTQKFHPEKTLNFQPHPSSPAGAGKNVKVHLKHDPDPVQARWDEVMKPPHTELQETAIDVQVDRLLMAREYMLSRRQQVAEQLTALKSWLGAS
jgi:hypothetical protein